MTLAVCTLHPSSLLLSAHLLPLPSSADCVDGFQEWGQPCPPAALMAVSAPVISSLQGSGLEDCPSDRFSPWRENLRGSAWQVSAPVQSSVATALGSPWCYSPCPSVSGVALSTRVTADAVCPTTHQVLGAAFEPV